MTDRSIDADLLAGAQSSEFKYVVFVKLAFPSGTVYAHNGAGTYRFSTGDVENILTYSEDLTNADWSKTRAVISAGVTYSGPEGDVNLDKITDDASGGTNTSFVNHVAYTVETETHYIAFAHVQKGNNDWVRLGVDEQPINIRQWFNLNTLATGDGTNSVVRAGVTNLGDDFRLIWLEFLSDDVDTTARVAVSQADGNGSTTITVDGTNYLYAGGFMIHKSADAEWVPATYIKTTSASVTGPNQQTYLGVGAFGSIDAVEDSLQLTDHPVKITLSSINQEIIEAVKSDDVYGRDADIYLGAINADGELLGTPENWYSGFMENMSINLGKTDAVSVSIQNRAVNFRLRTNRKYTLEDHQLDYSGDQIFEFLEFLQDLNISWAGEQVRTGFVNTGTVNPNDDTSAGGRTSPGGPRRGK